MCPWRAVESLYRRLEVLTRGKQRDTSYSPSVEEIWREGVGTSRSVLPWDEIQK